MMLLARERQRIIGVCLLYFLVIFCSMSDVTAMVVNDIISVTNDKILTARKERYKYEGYKCVVFV